MRLIWIAALIMLITAGSGCYNDKYDKLYPTPADSVSTTTCNTDTVSYATDIKPIITSNCYSPGNGCHDAAGSATSGFDYQSSITALQNNAKNGALVGCISWSGSYPDMPLGGSKLSSCNIAKITKWVNEGAPNN